MLDRLITLRSVGALPLILTFATISARAAQTDVCLSTGCYDLMTGEGLRAYITALEGKSASAGLDPDYSDLSAKKREKLREAEIALAQSAISPPAGHLRYFYLNTLLEVRRSLELRSADPLPHGTDLIKVPYGIFRDLFRSPYIKGKVPATAGPQAATFREDRDIESLDLQVGMRPTLRPGTENSVICEYDKKKDSHGTNPGFTVNCGEDKVKIKFGEVRTEPFLTRIMWALGYHVDPADFATNFRVRYNPNIFTEFNTQPGLPARVKIAKIPVFKTNSIKRGVRIEDFIDHAVLKNGTRISRSALETALRNPEEETKIEYVSFNGVQIQRDHSKVIKVGPWSYNEFDHPENEDMRAFVGATAWIGNYDVRLDNNRLALDLAGHVPEWKFIISDLGFGLGRATSRYGRFNSSDNLPDFRRSVAKNDRLARYRTFESNEAFMRATPREVSRVVARIMRLSEKQIRDALFASGFQAAEAEAYLFELLRRREELAQAFPSQF